MLLKLIHLVNVNLTFCFNNTGIDLLSYCMHY